MGIIERPVSEEEASQMLDAQLLGDPAALAIRVLAAAREEDHSAVLCLKPLSLARDKRNVTFDYSDKDIMERYRQFSEVLGSEVNQSKEVKQAYTALLESHNVLLDPERRQAYLRAATEKLTRLKASARFSGVRRQNEEVLSRVARGLSAHDPDVRWTALMQLSLIGEDPEAYSAQLASLMQDKDDLVKWTAMEAVAKMGEEAIAFADTLAAAVEKGRHTDAHMAKIAAGVLGNIGVAAGDFAQPVSKLLTHKDHTVRRVGVEVLGKMQAVEYAKALVEMFADVNVLVRLHAMEAAVSLPCSNVSKLVIPYMECENKDARDTAAQALQRMGEAAAEHCSELALLLQNEHFGIRESAVVVLSGLLGTERGVHQLGRVLRMLEDSHPRVRWAVVKGIQGGACPEKALANNAQQVMDLMGNSDCGVRRTAQECLKEVIRLAVGQEKLVEAAAQDGNPLVCKCMMDVLKRLDQTELMTHMKSLGMLITNQDPEVRQQCADLIGKMGPIAAEGSGLLVELLHDKDARVRWAAVTGLGKMGSSASHHGEALRKLSQDGDAITRRAAMDALKRMAMQSHRSSEQNMDRYNPSWDVSSGTMSMHISMSGHRSMMGGMNGYNHGSMNIFNGGYDRRPQSSPGYMMGGFISPNNQYRQGSRRF